MDQADAGTAGWTNACQRLPELPGNGFASRNWSLRSCSFRCVLLLAAPLLLLACTPTRLETGIHPAGREYAELPVDLGPYKSAQTRAGQNPKLALAVSISGGGERAANFGVGVLLGLEALAVGGPEGSNALEEVDYLSTVSGGGFAAGAYISSLHDYLQRGGDPRAYSFHAVFGTETPRDAVCDERPPYQASHKFSPCVRWQLERGYEKDITGFWKLWRATSWKVLFTDLDRTNLLENAIDDDLLGVSWRCQADPGGCATPGKYSLKLADIFVPANAPQAVRLPYWVANATTFEDGNIFPYTPSQLMRYRVTEYTHRLNKVRYPGDKFDSADYERWINDMPMALGVTASGNFPAALPATTLKTRMDRDNRFLHLLDGGLGDNLGILTATRLLADPRNEAVRRRVLIVVDAFRDSLGPFSQDEAAPTAADAVNRTTSIGLDGWRARYQELAEAIAAAKGVEKPIVIRFEDLNDEAELAALLSLPQAGLGSLVLESSDVASLTRDLAEAEQKAGTEEKQVGVRMALPYRLLRNVATSYNVSSPEQKLLVAAGRRIVQKKAKEISDALTVTGGR